MKNYTTYTIGLVYGKYLVTKLELVDDKLVETKVWLEDTLEGAQRWIEERHRAMDQFYASL